MKAIEVIADFMEATRATTLRVVDGVTQEQAKWRPAYGANSIGFILWHVARSQDSIFHRALTSGEQVWGKNGWYEKFGLPVGDTGNGYTPEQVEEFKVPPLGELLVYLAEVQMSALEVLRSIEPRRFSEVPRPDRSDLTVLSYLRMGITHENQHTGAIELLRGFDQNEVV